MGLGAGAAGFGVAGLVGAAFVVEVFGWVGVVVLVKDGVGVGVGVVRVNRAVVLSLADHRLVTRAERR